MSARKETCTRAGTEGPDTQSEKRRVQEMAENRIGILSDTHGLLREEVLEALKGCGAILHAGDVGGPEILERLSAIAPVYAVRGNTDRDWEKPLPETLSVTLFGVRFFQIHNRKKAGELPECDIVLSGHTHKYEERREGSRLFLNPGSCGPKRFLLPVTMAVLKVSENGWQAERLDLPAGTQGGTLSVSGAEKADSGTDAGVSGVGALGRETGAFGANAPEMKADPGEKTAKGLKAGSPEAYMAQLPEKDLKKLVSDIMRSVDRGRPVKELAEKYRIGEELAELICRLYVTHPGIDAEGIINKMGIYNR